MPIEQSLTALPVETVIEEAPHSIAEHAATYGPDALREEPDDPAGPLKPIRPVDQQKREQGKFAEGRQRLRSKDAVARINELTGRAKTAEEKAVSLESEVTRLRAIQAPPAQIARAEAKADDAHARVHVPDAAFPEAEPDENDPKFGGDYAKYLRAAAAWEGRKAYHDARQTEQQAITQSQREQQQQSALKSFGARLDAAKAKYPDFDQVLAKPVPWLNAQTGEPYARGIAIDYFVREHDNGGDLLHYLMSDVNAVERDALARLELKDQLPKLALLLQRFASPDTSTQVGITGSATGRQLHVVLPPKPPNPVRTEAQRASGPPPPTDGSLSIAEHGRAFGAKRR